MTFVRKIKSKSETKNTYFLRRYSSKNGKMLRVAILFALFAVVYMELTLQTKLNNQWQSFKTKHLKSYKEGEDVQRQENFKKNVETILNHNLKVDMTENGHRLAVNEFSDMSIEEFRSKMLGFKAPTRRANNTLQSSGPMPTSLPATVDWRTYGYVTPVKNQGSCGSCYTYAAAQALEGAWARATGLLVSLSQQQMLDCATEAAGYSNFGCEGGFPDSAFQYIIDNNGLSTEACYPYRMKQNSYCMYNPACRGATMRTFVDIKEGDERQMMAAVAMNGPVSVGLDAGQEDFMSYKSGVYSNPKCNNQQGNHAVLVIGYGTENGQDYWLIKNSWGTSWGIAGYMKMARNSQNMCGIANAASYPIV